ncbi:MAG: BLUF domain-containing protein [Amaricoccus sp.]
MQNDPDQEKPPRKPAKLLQLVYVSTATRRLADCDLHAIAEASRRHNAAAGLTGLLLYQGGFFHGVLEGQASRVLRRMEVIITDERHRELHILREHETRERRFATWTFSALPHSAQHLAPLPSQSEFLHILSNRLR